MRKTRKRISKKRSVLFHLVYYWTKLVCINSLTLTESNELRFSHYSAIYAIFLTVGYSYVWHVILLGQFELLLPGQTQIGIICIIFALGIEFLKSATAWFIYGFRQNRLKLIVKSFMKVEATFTTLAVQVDYEKCLKQLAIYMAVVSITFIGWMIFNNSPSLIDQGFKTVIWICYIVPGAMTFNRWTMIIWVLMVVKKQFRGLNEKVRFLIKIDNSLLTIPIESRHSSKSNPNRIRLADKIRLIAELHRQLRGLTYRTIDYIAVYLILDIMEYSFDINVCVHMAYRFLKDRQQIIFKDALYLFAVAVWIVVPISMLTILSNACGSIAEEANETGKILHATFNDVHNFGEIPEAAKLNVLSLDLLQNRMRISLFGFFHLDYFFVYRALTTVTTLLTIMLQFCN